MEFVGAKRLTEEDLIPGPKLLANTPKRRVLLDALPDRCPMSAPSRIRSRTEEAIGHND